MIYTAIAAVVAAAANPWDTEIDRRLWRQTVRTQKQGRVTTVRDEEYAS